MSVVSEQHRLVSEFFECYIRHNSGWCEAVYHMGYDPYFGWNDDQWVLWNKLNDEYEMEDPNER